MHFRTAFDHFFTLLLIRYLKDNPPFLFYSVTKVIEKVLFLVLFLFQTTSGCKDTITHLGYLSLQSKH